MGFRNPITSADAVDTGGGLIPGVKVYSDQGNPGRGVVEWDAYGATASAALTSSQTGSGGTWFTLGLAGGPSVGMNYVGLPAGGYASELNLTAGDPAVGAIATLDSFLYYDRATHIGDQPTYGPGIAEWGDDVYVHLRYVLDAGGMVHVSGLAQINGTVTGKITNHGGSYTPLHNPGGKGVQHVIGGAVNDSPRLFDVRPDGIYLRGAMPPAGSGWIAVNGTFPSNVRTG